MPQAPAFPLPTLLLLSVLVPTPLPPAGAAPMTENPRAGAEAVAAAGADNEADAKLAALFDEYLEALFRDEPTTATRFGDRRFDDRLEELTDEAAAARLARDRRFRERLAREIDPESLSPAGRIDRAIFDHELERAIWMAENFQPHRDDPNVHVALMTESLYLPLTQSTAPKAEVVAKVLKRMDAIPGILPRAREVLARGEAPRVHVETAILRAEGAANFFEKDLFLLAERPADDPELAPRARACADAARGLAEFLKAEILPKSGETWRIGPEKYARKLELDLDSGLSPREILEEAEREAERVVAEMECVARMIWHRVFPGEPVPPDDPPGRAELVRRVLAETSKDHGTEESLVSDVVATVEEIKRFIVANDILRLPEPDRCAIREMPEFLRGFSFAYLNPAPPLDTAAVSEYAVSPPPADWTEDRKRSLFEEYNRAMLKVLTIHEAYPGHYVQLEYGNRHPSKIRRTLYSGVFAEGWAVYTERMMLDQGFGGGDPVLRLNQLKFYLRAVLNAILDQRMHTTEIGDGEAQALLMERGFQSEGEAVAKVRRAKLSSCQLSTYFVGRTAFHRLRQSIQRELGDEFDLGRYHEAVLDHGTISVKYLPALTRERLRRPR